MESRPPILVGSYDYARALAIQSDGKIVVAGQVEDPATGNDDIGLARYNTDGFAGQYL
jgi:hypothetical protein